MMITAYIDRATVELMSKSIAQIQIDTALIWCGRACAAANLNRHDDAMEYAHESIEHAALSGSDALLANVRAAMRRHGLAV